MEKFILAMQVRWSDLDPNFHLRHSVYYDWGAFCRVAYLDQIGLTAEVMRRHHIGPIIFREECIFRKEIRSADKVMINLQVVQARKDMSRCSFRHEIFKNGDILAAVLTVDFAWIDTVHRKVATLPAEMQQLFEKFPKAEEFAWV